VLRFTTLRPLLQERGSCTSGVHWVHCPVRLLAVRLCVCSRALFLPRCLSPHSLQVAGGVCRSEGGVLCDAPLSCSSREKKAQWCSFDVWPLCFLLPLCCCSYVVVCENCIVRLLIARCHRYGLQARPRAVKLRLQTCLRISCAFARFSIRRNVLPSRACSFYTSSGILRVCPTPGVLCPAGKLRPACSAC
jgi:hypothetical protein